MSRADVYDRKIGVYADGAVPNPGIVRWAAADGPILDVGASDGTLGAALKAATGQRVTGIEISPAACERAKAKLDEVHCLDVAAADPPFAPASFRLVVFADVLEHLPDPDVVLGKMVRYVAPGGRVLISLPNVAHWSIRWRLFTGRFDYEDQGILDNTHLRFFTLKTAKAMVERAGLRLEAVDVLPGTLAALPFQRFLGALHVHWMYRAVDGWLARVWKTLFAQQFILVCRAPGEPRS